MVRNTRTEAVTADFGDQEAHRGAGGETHQVAEHGFDTLTTQQARARPVAMTLLKRCADLRF